MNTHKDVQIILLPKNTTSVHQPLDGGIISSLKVQYKRAMMIQVSYIINDWEACREQVKCCRSGCAGLSVGSPAHVKDACDILTQVWKDYYAAIIMKCWLKSECLPAHRMHEVKELLAETPRGFRYSEDAQQEVEEIMTDLVNMMGSWTIPDSEREHQPMFDADHLDIINLNRLSVMQCEAN